MTTALAVTTASAGCGAAFGSRTRRSSLTGCGSSEYAELFFNIAAGAFFALHTGIHAGYELFELMTAIFTNVFINRHNAPQKIYSANCLITRQ